MRILFLTQIVPYPPDAGPKVKTWHVLRHLADAGHEIILASFVRPEEEKYLPHLREVCAEVVAVPLRRSRLADARSLLISLVKGSSFLVERDNFPQMHALVKKYLAGGTLDAIHADQFTMAQFALGLDRPIPRVFDAHNATWKIVARSKSQYPFYLRPVFAREIQRVKDFERRVVAEFEHTFTVTAVDRDFLLEMFSPAEQSAVAPKIIPTPISVDCDALTPLTLPPDSSEIVTLGTLHYPPNADGIRWFIQEVFPRILAAKPDTHLTVIGKNPPDDFLREAQRIPQSLTVTGYVPELKPFFERAALIVVPVRSGGGMRVRILEAFAYALPVVTTSAGLEGISAEPGKEVLVADSAAGFAADVLRLFQQPALRAALAANGRRLAENNYHWRNALRMMDEVYPPRRQIE